MGKNSSILGQQVAAKEPPAAAKEPVAAAGQPLCHSSPFLSFRARQRTFDEREERIGNRLLERSVHLV
jgi:hypothetical protein